MCDQLSSLNLSQPSVIGTLKCMELTAVVQATRTKKRSATDTLSEWLNIEEYSTGCIVEYISVSCNLPITIHRDYAHE